MSTFLCTRTSQSVSLGHMRIATAFVGGRRTKILSRTLTLQQGVLLLAAEGVSLGAFYDLPASGFTWCSSDGLVNVFNVTACTNGGLVDSGLGVGTVIRKTPSSDPMFCTVYLKDEPVSGG